MGTITKALDLLGYLSSKRPEIGLGEFVRLTGRDKATVHRHLSELQENGFLEQHPATRAYRLGPAVLRLAAVREETFPVRKLLRPIVSELSEVVGELAHASILQGDILSPVFHSDPRIHGIQVHFDESELLPLHATASGIALLAFGEPGLHRTIFARRLKKFTSHTVTEPEAILEMAEQTRRAGVSKVSGAFDSEVSSQAAPIFGENGRAIGAISVATPTVRAEPGRDAEIAVKLLAAARDATRSMGGVFPSLSREADPRSPILND